MFSFCQSEALEIWLLLFPPNIELTTTDVWRALGGGAFVVGTKLHLTSSGLDVSQMWTSLKACAFPAGHNMGCTKLYNLLTWKLQAAWLKASVKELWLCFPLKENMRKESGRAEELTILSTVSSKQNMSSSNCGESVAWPRYRNCACNSGLLPSDRLLITMKQKFRDQTFLHKYSVSTAAWSRLWMADLSLRVLIARMLNS